MKTVLQYANFISKDILDNVYVQIILYGLGCHIFFCNYLLFN